jgi:putative transposase
MAIHEYQLSERQACHMLDLSRSGYRYQKKQEADEPVKVVLKELSKQQPTWGFEKMTDLIRQSHPEWNHKRIHRIYCEIGLNLTSKRKKRLPARNRQPLCQPERANQSWSLDFMSDSFAGGRPFRTLNILDDFNREVVWIEVDTSLPAERVIRVLETAAIGRGLPEQIRMDNGPELISKALAEWAEKRGVNLVHIQPGKPAQNAYIERFNRTFREDVLDAYVFQSLEEVRDLVDPWIESYNEIRPHESLGGMSPYQYAAARG